MLQLLGLTKAVTWASGLYAYKHEESLKLLDVLRDHQQAKQTKLTGFNR